MTAQPPRADDAPASMEAYLWIVSKRDVRRYTSEPMTSLKP